MWLCTPYPRPYAELFCFEHVKETIPPPNLSLKQKTKKSLTKQPFVQAPFPPFKGLVFFFLKKKGRKKKWKKWHLPHASLSPKIFICGEIAEIGRAHV